MQRVLLFVWVPEKAGTPFEEEEPELIFHNSAKLVKRVEGGGFGPRFRLNLKRLVSEKGGK
jgi:hypothetical protein